MEEISVIHDSAGLNDSERNCPYLVRSETETAQIYSRHIDTVYRTCFSMMGNAHDAEDAAQAAFMKMMTANPEFSDTEHEKAWLIVTARNCCRDLLRQWWRRNTVATPPDDETMPASTMDNSDLPRNFMNLPSKQRIALYLHYYEGYKLKEIASMFKLSENTVKSQIRSAKRRLQIELEDE